MSWNLSLLYASTHVGQIDCWQSLGNFLAWSHSKSNQIRPWQRLHRRATVRTALNSVYCYVADARPMFALLTALQLNKSNELQSLDPHKSKTMHIYVHGAGRFTESRSRHKRFHSFLLQQLAIRLPAVSNAPKTQNLRRSVQTNIIL
jgi:hypothetical protein